MITEKILNNLLSGTLQGINTAKGLAKEYKIELRNFIQNAGYGVFFEVKKPENFLQTAWVISNLTQNITLPARLPATLKRLICVNVGHLDCRNTQFPEDLEALAFNNCGLTELPPNLPKNLKTLELNSNKISDLGLGWEKFQHLEQLHCSNNNLSSLPEHLPSKLQVLNFEHNQVKFLPAKLPPALKTFWAAHNQLQNLNTIWSKSLRCLLAGYNQISQLPERFGNQLIELSLTHNQLTAFNSILGKSTRVLDCSHNQIRTISGLNKELETLYCNNNCLERLDVLPARLLILNAGENYALQEIAAPLPKKLQTLSIPNTSLETLPNVPEGCNTDFYETPMWGG
jgi:Leucine-rich repeat (LRR) protein